MFASTRLTPKSLFTQPSFFAHPCHYLRSPKKVDKTCVNYPPGARDQASLFTQKKRPRTAVQDESHAPIILSNYLLRQGSQPVPIQD
jgi:hypothetical protein